MDLQPVTVGRCICRDRSAPSYKRGVSVLILAAAYAALGRNAEKRTEAAGLPQPVGHGAFFARHVRTKRARAIYFTLMVSSPFVATYFYEWVVEPEMLAHVILIGLPWLLIVIFAAAALPFRLEALDAPRSEQLTRAGMF